MFTVPAGRLAVVIARLLPQLVQIAAAMAMPTIEDALRPTASVTCSPIEYVPDALGVPEMTPAAARESPGGNWPDVIDQLYGGVPPTTGILVS